MKVVHAFGRIYDLFASEQGWDNWTRVAITENRGGACFFQYVDGYALNKETLSRLQTNFKPKQHYQNV
jgi:hypothetical protein